MLVVLLRRLCLGLFCGFFSRLGFCVRIYKVCLGLLRSVSFVIVVVIMMMVMVLLLRRSRAVLVFVFHYISFQIGKVCRILDI